MGVFKKRARAEGPVRVHGEGFQRGPPDGRPLEVRRSTPWFCALSDLAVVRFVSPGGVVPARSAWRASTVASCTAGVPARRLART